MAIAYRAHSQGDGVDATAEGTIPTGTTTNDFELGFITAIGAGTTITTGATGWTERQADPNPADFSLWYYDRLWQSGDANPVWTESASGGWSADLISLSGTDTAGPVSASASAASVGTANALVLSVTPAHNDCMLVYYAAVDASTAGSARTWTVSGNSGTANEIELFLSPFHRVIYYEQISGGSGVAQSRTLTVSGTAQDMGGFIVALKPSATDLVVQNAAQAQTAGNVSLTQTHVLAVAGVNQAQAAGSVALTQVHNLAVAGAVQGQSAANVVPTQVHSLAVAGAIQAQSAENVTVNVATNLVVANATQAQTAQQVTLTQTHSLTVQGAAQLQAASTVSLAQVHALGVQSASQAQSAGLVVLTQTHILTVQGSTQAQTSTTITLGTDPVRDITVVARLRSNHVTGGVALSDLVAGVRSNHITGGVDVPRDLRTGSVEYVTAEATFVGETAASIATATGVVQFTTTDTTPTAADPNWAAADVTERTDVNGGALLALKKLHTAGAAGEYRVWAKVTDNPEVLILKCGTFSVR